MNKKLKHQLIYIALIMSHFAMFMMILKNTILKEETIVLASTNSPTPSPLPTPTAGQSVKQEVETVVETDITVKVSHYNPELGGVNCAVFKDGKCVSRLANGEDWEKYISTKNVIACPKELKLGTQIKVLGRVWTCKDRGGKITKTESGAYWIDMLVRETPIAYGTEVPATIIR